MIGKIILTFLSIVLFIFFGGVIIFWYGHLVLGLISIFFNITPIDKIHSEISTLKKQIAVYREILLDSYTSTGKKVILPNKRKKNPFYLFSRIEFRSLRKTAQSYKNLLLHSDISREKTFNLLLREIKNNIECNFSTIFYDIRKKIELILCASNFRDYRTFDSEVLMLCVFSNYYISKKQISNYKKEFLYNTIKHDFKSFKLNKYKKAIQIYKDQIYKFENTGNSQKDLFDIVIETFLALIKEPIDANKTYIFKDIFYLLENASYENDTRNFVIPMIKKYLSVVVSVLDRFCEIEDSSINKLLSKNTSPDTQYEFIDSIYNIKEEHIGKNVRLIGNCREAYLNNIQKNQINYELYESNGRRGTSYILLELIKPLPAYISSNCFYNLGVRFDYPIVLRGTLYKNSDKTSHYRYILKNAVFDEYWRDNNGTVICDKQKCKHKCNLDCPIHANRTGRKQLDLKNYEEAEKAFQKGLKIAPYYSDLWFNLGNVYMQEEKFESAYESYYEADKLCINKERCLYGLIFSLVKIGRIKEAEEYFTNYKSKYPGEAEEELNNLIADFKEKIIETAKLSDDEYAELFDEDYEEFWNQVIKEKENTFSNVSCNYKGAAYRNRREFLKGFTKLSTRDSIELLQMRNNLINNNIYDASSLCMFDVIDEYIKHNVKF